MNHVCVYALQTYFVCACVCFAERYMLYKVMRDPSSLSCGSTVLPSGLQDYFERVQRL